MKPAPDRVTHLGFTAQLHEWTLDPAFTHYPALYIADPHLGQWTITRGHSTQFVAVGSSIPLSRGAARGRLTGSVYADERGPDRGGHAYTSSLWPSVQDNGGERSDQRPLTTLQRAAVSAALLSVLRAAKRLGHFDRLLVATGHWTLQHRLACVESELVALTTERENLQQQLAAIAGAAAHGAACVTTGAEG